jgi:hypothetical protein
MEFHRAIRRARLNTSNLRSSPTCLADASNFFETIKANNKIVERTSMTNRHERRKAAVTEITMPASEFHAANSICAWEGCMEIADHQQGAVYLPKGWTALLMFWAEKAPRNIILDLSAGDVLRDCVLCPKHTGTVQLQLKMLNREGRATQ